MSSISSVQGKLVRTLYRGLFRSTKSLQALPPAAWIPVASTLNLPTTTLPLQHLRNCFRTPSVLNLAPAQYIDHAFSTLRAVNNAIQQWEAAQTQSAHTETDAEPDYPHPSTAGNRVSYNVGQVIQHNVHQYRAVIIGVHSTCQASDAWCKKNGITNREQPFYTALVDVRDRSDAQVTYIAQEFVQLLSSQEQISTALHTPSALQAMITKSFVVHPLISKHFSEYRPLYGDFLPKMPLLHEDDDSDGKDDDDGVDNNRSVPLNS